MAAVARALSPGERRRASSMFASIAALHIVGFGVFIAFVVPSHYKGLGIGVAGLAYSLGLRHAFDADHISAIDNTTRKLMSEGKRPLSIGYWFSLGHSTIVVAIGVGIVVAEKAVYGAVSNQQLRPRAVRRRVRHGRLGDVPVPDRAAQRRHPRGDLSRVPLDAPRRLRRGRARAPAEQPRADVPPVRPLDEDDRQGVEDVPGRGRVRHGLRHRDRGRAAGHDRAARLPAPAASTRSCACRSCSPPAWR